MKVLYLFLIILLIIIITIFLYFFIQRINTSPVDSHIESEIEYLTPQEKIQINIFNGTEKQGLANFLRKYFIDRGFDVVEIGNYSKIADSTIVIDRIGDSLSAQKVASLLGIGKSRIKKKIDSSLFVRASIIIGLDYENLKPFNRNK